MSFQQGYDTGNDKIPNIPGGLKYKEVDGNDDHWRSLTYYGHVAYSYKQRYFLQGSLAVETSSRFGKDVTAGLKMCGVPWGIFPSIQGAWLVSSESWFPKTNAFNMLKLNAGFDISGNDDIDYYASRSYFTSSRFMTAVTGLGLSNIGNTKLQWETTRRFTVGLDMNLLSNRLGISANFFTSKTDNLLALKDLKAITGLERNWSKDGDLKNSGFDVTKKGRNGNNKEWKCELGESIANNKNEIRDIPTGKAIKTKNDGADIG